MKKALEKAQALLHTRTTYGVGLLQTKAYRVLKAETDAVLAPYNITSVHWAVLGLAQEHPKGLRLSDIARELSVEAPFVTTLARHLSEKKWLTIAHDPADSRAKCVTLSKAGRTFLVKIEKLLRTSMRELLHGIPMGDLLSYLYVLETIVSRSDRT